MGLKNVLLTGASVVALATAAIPAHAAPIQTNQIQTNQWYTGAFNSTAASALFGPGTVLGANPTPGTNATVVFAPVNTSTPWTTVDLPFGGFLTVTDVENSGDSFDISVNGVDLGTTSKGTIGANCNNEIACAVSGTSAADFSHGTFVLPAGTDTFSGIVNTQISGGNFDFIIEANANPNNPVPEPVSLAVLGVGMAGLAAVRRRKR
ncbi:PEP-CTERM sorting domain-containing protein [Acidisphaera sp. S103]|uniref:PEP-CTERM sorting domain-containing protein n=1 Tax=Acidisphaera sp. S103 TaxID=1747223 RepID=UPI001C20658A|nr:PEP-CTERM sorting domain-containing protein [Acidisphaera sp. S103]